MKQTRIRMRKNVRNFWRSYMGFHFSHSIGLISFASIFFTLSVFSPALLFEPAFLSIMIGIGAVYAVLSRFFWFSIPLWGSVIATLLLGAGSLINRLI